MSDNRSVLPVQLSTKGCGKLYANAKILDTWIVQLRGTDVLSPSMARVRKRHIIRH